MHPVEFPVEVFERRCGSCHGHDPPSSGSIGKGRYFVFGGPGPALPLVHDFMDLKKLRGAVGYFEYGRSRTPQSLCNLTRPDKSLLLRAPLARRAGGLERCEQVVFENVSDPDYQQILAAIQDARRRHEREGRFDMPDFRPNDHYIIQMQRFGVLPSELPSSTRIDPYATDEAYWRSFWYRPRSLW
jgi:hypothetical protein